MTTQRSGRITMRNVAFQGEHGAYSEQAALAHFGSTVETVPLRTLQKVFDYVEKKRAEFGVVPAENSLEGSVNLTYDLLLDSPLRISGEVKIKISHCLMALPETSLENLKVIYSHPQALAQCANFLERLKVDVEPTYDTAGSAKMIRDKQATDAAAIASEHAAELYRLKILKRNIEDYAENYTRFFIIGYEDSMPTGRDKTTIVFAAKHVPGSLHRALGELASRGINLTRIESRPTKKTPWEYNFFIDFEGHRSDVRSAEALDALQGAATFLKVLGSYPRSD